ncbi:hypothetical protein N8649_02730 [bacterium]|nr:hypothetical protein [bacterium]
MKYLSLVRLLAIVAFGLLSSCSEKDERANDKDERANDKDEIPMDEGQRVLKEFREGPLAALDDKENLKKLKWHDYSKWTYDVQKTDSLISPYTATIKGDGIAYNSPYINKGESIGVKILIKMAYQDDKWVYKERRTKTDGRDEWSGNIKGIGPFWGYKKDDVWYWGNGDVWKRAE